jgi:hypothetical protein
MNSHPLSPDSSHPEELARTGALLSANSSSAALSVLIRQIDALKSRVAEEFLELAGLLQTNSQHAREITTASHRATGGEIAQQSSHAITVLERVLTDSASVTDMVECSTQKITEILGYVNEVDAPLSRLSKMSTLLQVVGVLCKIEGGKITDNTVDTSSLATDIDRMATEVTQHVEQIVDDASTLSGLLHGGVADLKCYTQKEHADSSDLIARTQSLLGPALSRAQAAQQAARTIDQKYADFHRATDKIVMGLQSEDLARQRIEHVQEALNRVAARLDSGDSAASCASILTLQSAQLAGTRDLLADSLSNIHTGLNSLIPQIKELRAQTTTLAKQTHVEGESFAKLIDDGMYAVTEVFRQCSSSANSVVSIVSRVLPSVEKMSDRASALETIESAIRLISLNATVKTSLLGAEGAAMGVLASELHRITTERGSDATLVLTSLRAIRQALNDIRKEKSSDSVTGASILAIGNDVVVSEELAGLSATVRSASQQAALGHKEVEKLADSLCTELARGVELAQRAASLRDSFDRLLDSFNATFEQLGISAVATPQSHATNVSQDLSSLYSMHSERVLHQRTFGDDTPPKSTPKRDAIPDTANEFGEDIELF